MVVSVILIRYNQLGCSFKKQKSNLCFLESKTSQNYSDSETRLLIPKIRLLLLFLLLSADIRNFPCGESGEKQQYSARRIVHVHAETLPCN